jgi:hypothetical protein
MGTMNSHISESCWRGGGMFNVGMDKNRRVLLSVYRLDHKNSVHYSVGDLIMADITDWDDA